MTDKPQDQAFPAAYTVGPNDDLYPPTPGMTLRDYFAAGALPAVMARMHEDIQHLGSPTFPQNVAGHAYRIADAMLAERTK